MKPLVESLFDKDLVQQGVMLNVDAVYETVCAALKKYNLEDCPYEKLNIGYIPDKNIIMMESESDYFSFTVLHPNYLVKSAAKGLFDTDEEVLTGVSFVIGTDEDEYNDDYVYLLRVDVHWVGICGNSCAPSSSCLWDRKLWKHYSRLKTNRITSETIDDIIKYILTRIDKSFQMAVKDKQEIYDIKAGKANSGGDPLMYGKKDRVWYLEKMKKGLRR